MSYWRRIIQARIDLLTRGSSDGDIVERLTTVLAESGAGIGGWQPVGQARRGHRGPAGPARPVDPVVDPRDTEAVAAFVEELRAGETDISALAGSSTPVSTRRPGS